MNQTYIEDLEDYAEVHVFEPTILNVLNTDEDCVDELKQEEQFEDLRDEKILQLVQETRKKYNIYDEIERMRIKTQEAEEDNQRYMMWEERYI